MLEQVNSGDEWNIGHVHVHVHVFPRYVGDGFGWVEPEDRNDNRNRLVETRFQLVNIINNLDD
ncbi:hypothetical protein ASG89_13135 [Paenibacillus sp. Soil766]|uniref:hypothetical protein n=1 Tax=Paenibacillus sp. Soil766 TaxID=1736404 RepID=UPI00070ED721|nr:hypothetical protein [Paenibacillus sp. Soil766]KRE83067.1 hypothetical protein ASG89_13135 [Paenibacillus sp. Soil766]